MKPVLIVIAGANGSGKTSLTSKIISHEWSGNCAYINPDNSLKAAVAAEAMRNSNPPCKKLGI